MSTATDLETELDIQLETPAATEHSSWGATLVAAMLSPAPRKLLELEAELLMYRGQYLLHYKEGVRERFKLLTPTALRAAFNGQPVDSGWLPPGTVRWGEGARGKFVARWMPPAVHRLLIEVDVQEPAKKRRKNKGKRTQVEEVRVPLPGLVMLGVAHTYSIWAVPGSSFDGASPVFHAPLSNVYENGGICWGSAQPPEVSVETFGQACALFFSSTFNDHLMGRRCRSFPNDVRVHLLQLASSGATEYPEGELLPYEHRYAGTAGTISEVVDSRIQSLASETRVL